MAQLLGRCRRAVAGDTGEEHGPSSSDRETPGPYCRANLSGQFFCGRRLVFLGDVEEVVPRGAPGAGLRGVLSAAGPATAARARSTIAKGGFGRDGVTDGDASCQGCDCSPTFAHQVGLQHGKVRGGGAPTAPSGDNPTEAAGQSRDYGECGQRVVGRDNHERGQEAVLNLGRAVTAGSHELGQRSEAG